ncbi:putative RNA polymerase II subunit B1 CTD phosphatase RPAP2 isoform 2-T2 [Discoglossus pictus]
MAERKSTGKARKAHKKSSGNLQISDLTSEDAAKRRAALEIAVRRKIESEKKALHIVERLLEDDVTEDLLVDCGQFISPAHYKDVVEERFIIRSCGYPICNKKLENVPKQKYRISTKTNKVYDITERKCFCSNFCYRASKYYETQIPSSPIWMRAEESGQSGLEIKLTEKCITTEHIEKPVTAENDDNSEHPGDEATDDGPEQEFVSSIISGDRHCPIDLETEGKESDKTYQNNSIKSTDQDTDLVEATERLHLSDHNGTILGESLSDTSKSPTTKSTDISSSSEPSTEEVPGVTLIAVSKRGAEHLRKILSNSKKYQSAPTVVVKGSMLDVLTQTLSEWKTEETLKYLYGSDYTVASSFPDEDVSLDSNAVEDLDEDDLEASDVEPPKVDSTTSLNESLTFENSNNVVKPVPDYEKLKEESDILKIKVKEFFRGHYILPEELEHKQNVKDKTDKSQKKGMSWAPTLPLVDSCSQQQVRKRIVLEKLKKVLPAILLPLQITYSDVSKELHNLVKTFRFTNKNITHTTSEWSIIAIVLLFALLPTMPLHKDSQQSPLYTQFISKLLEELQFQREDLETLKRKFTSRCLVI